VTDIRQSAKNDELLKHQKKFLQKTGSLPLPKCVAQTLLTGNPD
jgi:hypothetical protein